MKLFRTEEDRLIEEYYQKQGRANVAQNDADQAKQAVINHDPNTDPAHVSNEGIKSCSILFGHLIAIGLVICLTRLAGESVDKSIDIINTNFAEGFPKAGMALYAIVAGWNFIKNFANYWTAKPANHVIGPNGKVDVKYQ